MFLQQAANDKLHALLQSTEYTGPRDSLRRLAAHFVGAIRCLGDCWRGVACHPELAWDPSLVAEPPAISIAPSAAQAAASADSVQVQLVARL